MFKDLLTILYSLMGGTFSLVKMNIKWVCLVCGDQGVTRITLYTCTLYATQEV